MNKLIVLFSLLICHSVNSIAETQLTLSPSILHFDYTEFSPSDVVLDRELGWIPGIKANLNYSFLPGWNLDLYSSYYQGTVKYNGQTSAGGAHSTLTDTRLLELGGQVNIKTYKAIALLIGARSRQWDRNIRSTRNVGGIDEKYNWLEYSAGLHSDLEFNNNHTLSVEVSYLLIRKGTIDVNFSGTSLGSAHLNLGNGTGARLLVNWKTLITKNSQYDLSLFAEGWAFGRSNTKQAQGGSSITFVTEPRSETFNKGLNFNVKYLF